MIDHISPSMLGLYCRCQEAFCRRYLDGEIIPPGIAAVTGTGMHKAAEADLTQKISTGVDMPLEDMQDACRDGYMQAVRSGVFVPRGDEGRARQDLEDGLARALNLVSVFAEHVAPRIQPTASEQKLESFYKDLPVPFMGIIDTRDAGRIYDFKSASRKWPAGKEAGQMQPAFYTWLARESAGEELAFQFEVISDKAHQSIPVSLGEDAMLPMAARARSLLLSVQTGDFLPAEPGHWMCSPKWCGYWWSCRHIPSYLKNPSAS